MNTAAAVHDGVERAGPGDVEDVAAVLAAVLHASAVCVWMLPDERERCAVLLRLAHGWAGAALERGLVLTTRERDAVALWFHHPDTGPCPQPYRCAPAAMLAPAHRANAALLDGYLATAHPPYPHDCLSVLAVLPARQRRGTGTRLLRAGHDALAAAGRPTYLEACDARARAAYRRLGYEDAAGQGILLPRGPRLYPMRRPWTPVPGQRVAVREEVAGWAGRVGTVRAVEPPPVRRPVHVLLDDPHGPHGPGGGDGPDGGDERTFAAWELRPHPPAQPCDEPGGGR